MGGGREGEERREEERREVSERSENENEKKINLACTILQQEIPISSSHDPQLI